MKLLAWCVWGWILGVTHLRQVCLLLNFTHFTLSLCHIKATLPQIVLMLFICKKDKAVKNGLQPFWHSSFSFQSWKSHSGPKNTLSSSKLNRLHVKSVGALFKQIHICCGFCHFYSQAKSISAVASKTEAFSEGTTAAQQ